MSAIAAYKRFGVTNTQIHSLMINHWNFPKSYIDCLSYYYKLQWSGSRFHTALKDGTISHLGKQYIVVYAGCFAAQVCKSAQVELSFRAPQDEFSLQSYVLVKPISI
jgi:hypothetical protein